MATLDAILSQLGEEVQDAEEETFVLYSQPFPSSNLGFVDPKATEVEVEVAGKEYTIHQSPTVLLSNRKGGTTGAVLWKIAAPFASWLSSSLNPLLPLLSQSQHQPQPQQRQRRRQQQQLQASTILELGCGISPLSGLSLLPFVHRYILTDQVYVSKLLQRNIDANIAISSSSSSSRRKALTAGKDSPASKVEKEDDDNDKLLFQTLDWETDDASPTLTHSPHRQSFDAIVSCDCIYNYALARPFVQTCIDVCRLREKDSEGEQQQQQQQQLPTLCIIAQQLRNDEVFEGWLRLFHEAFHTWRVPDGMLPAELKSDRGFVVHVGILRETNLWAPKA